MMLTAASWIGGSLGALWLLQAGRRRLLLSRAKHPSLRGHARIARRVAGWLPFYEYGPDEFFACDGAPAEVVDRRRLAFDLLGRKLRAKAPKTLAASAGLADMVSDVAFVDHYRVPFQFRERVRQQLPLGNFVAESRDRRLIDLDGNVALDLTGAYGVNVFGQDFYKGCIARGVAAAAALGPVLGPYHVALADNVRRLRAISGLDEVSFHMSGTEAVMQAVRLARYHTRRSHVVRFCGAYHGWWDGVQAGPGNPRPAHECYTLRDMHPASLAVLRSRRDIACVLVNPLQAMHPNGNAPGDSTLVGGERRAGFDKAAYTEWLRQLRQVCTECGIVLIFDEVFLGFRLAKGGAQEYFGVRADIVTYGKTLGGGLPIGVVCGKADLMRRFRADRPADICFARGTFNSHPYVMTAMQEFLQFLETPEAAATWTDLDARWDGRRAVLNERLAAADLPIRVTNLASIWTTLFSRPGRYHWLFQYYLRLHGLAISWVGSGRFIFSHDFTDADCAEFADRFLAAALEMRDDGWLWTDANTTAKSIGRQVMRETVATLLGRRPQAAPVEVPGGTAIAARVAIE